MNNHFILLIVILCSSISFTGTPKDDKIKKKLTITTTIHVPIFNERVMDLVGLEDTLAEFRIIKSECFWGAVFPKNIGLDYSPSSNRYTLSNHEIELAEQLISENMLTFRRVLRNRCTDHKIKYPYSLSYKKLENYYRRYVGYKNKSGEILVRIFFEKMPLENTSLIHFPMIFDGVDYTWFDITVNLTKRNIMVTPSDINML